MSLFKHLQLQVVDPQEDGSISELDRYIQDDIIDLNYEADVDEMLHNWDIMTQDMHE